MSGSMLPASILFINRLFRCRSLNQDTTVLDHICASARYGYYLFLL